MFLNRDFCMEKLLAREVTIFRKKIKNFNILLKCIQPSPNSKTNLPVVQTFECQKICQIPKLKIFGLSPLPMQKPS